MEVRYGSPSGGVEDWKKVGTLRVPKSSYESPVVILLSDEYLIDREAIKKPVLTFKINKLKERIRLLKVDWWQELIKILDDEHWVHFAID